ncbi:QRFP-like peptide receptor [Ruditapes philippinarum]|uniref:QRFP-like peptide receptor n=1 Tax=Ruditapes philippinarum TaxID=129788 RepID=UPI00295C24CD|nr:QRFP-like peptide receptor [Ruditapes philippinarum]
MENYENLYMNTEHGQQNGSNTSANTMDLNVNEMFIPIYLYIIVSLVNAVIFIVGTFGNILVIIAVLKFREMRTPTNMFLLNLSVADILVLLICQPAGLVEFFGKDRWFLGQIMCKLVPLMENGVLHVSILTMIAVTMERYIALCHPFNRNRMSDKICSTIKICIAIWIVGFVIALPFLYMTKQEDARFYDGSPIKVCRTIIDETLRYIYIVMIAIVFFILPLIVLIRIYTKIIKQLTSDTLKCLTKNDKSALTTIRARKQVVKMLIVIIILFFLTLFPMRFMTLWLIFTPSNDVTKIGLEAFLNLISWTRVLMYINSACNPVIYSVTSTKFKSAFKKVLNRNVHSRLVGTMSTRCNGNENILRPVITYKPAFRNRSGDTRNEENPYLIIKVLILQNNENVPNCQGDGMVEEENY